MLKETLRVKRQTTAERHRYLEGLPDGFKGREGGVGTHCLCKCWFLASRTKYKLFRGSFSKLCLLYNRGVNNIQKMATVNLLGTLL